MLRNDKASIIAVSVLNYDIDFDAHVVKYEILIKSGIIRRRTVLYNCAKDLNKDQENKYLVERIKQEITIFNRGVKNKRQR